ncbi:MAG: hypothetical protein JWL96_1091 [Sphingomonas bacterium]|uniref:hypothetical protein n=1 Tax=Sphingomonas bacterium TaxID=1895847 RepID=UPI00260CFF8E|nr:hypothetical protein [Sphingomonas bacterium]MDB5709021.1 hypothetical protein [Sphingomonas bacterium]
MPDAATAIVTAFEYRYRDASNYKVSSRILLSGSLADEERALVMSKLHDDEFFVAEQVGIPPLREALYELSGGPTEDDHGWHEFIAFIDEAPVIDEPLWGSARDLALKFANVRSWDVAMFEPAMGERR